MRIIRIVGQVKIGLPNDDCIALRRCLHGIEPRLNPMNLQIRALLPENVPERVPLQLSLHLKLFIEKCILLVGRNGLDLRVDLFVTPLPENDDVHGFLNLNGGHLNIQINGYLLLIA